MNPVFRCERRVEFRDTDAAGFVHFSAFFFWMESAEHEFWRSVGVELVERLDGGCTMSWPRVAAACDFLGVVRYADVVAVLVRVERVGRTSVTFQFEFESGGKTVATGSMVAVRCRLAPGAAPEPVAIPEALVRKLSEFVA